MSIGTAIFASVVLVLVVYHKTFRRVVAWVVGVGGVLALLIVGIKYVNERHDANVFKREAVQGCIKRLNATGVAPSGFATIKDACEAYGGWEPQDTLNGFTYDAGLVAADRIRQRQVYDSQGNRLVPIPKGAFVVGAPKCNREHTNVPCQIPNGDYVSAKGQ